MEQISGLIASDVKITCVVMFIIIIGSMACMDFKLFKKRAQRAYRIGLQVCMAPMAIYREFFGSSKEYERNLKKYNDDKKRHQDSQLIPERPDWKKKSSDGGSEHVNYS